MKQALISTTEPRETGYRVAQVVAEGETFPVSAELFWAACADDVVADQFWYDPSNDTIKPIPVPVPTAAQNQATAVSLLAATDWVNEPDVVDPAVNPHLLNHAAFITYRSQVRAIAINPVAGNLDWPVVPTPEWSTG